MTARRIGLIADIHSHAPGAADLPAAVLDAFRGCELILVLGDAGESAVFDRLATCAPVQATRGADDPTSDARMVEGTRCVSVGASTVGAVFNLASDERGIATQPKLELPAGPVAPLMQGLFGRKVDVVAYAGTHRAAVEERDGVLFVNPGSPTFSETPSVVVLEIDGGRRSAHIVCIEPAAQPPAP